MEYGDVNSATPFQATIRCDFLITQFIQCHIFSTVKPRKFDILKVDVVRMQSVNIREFILFDHIAFSTITQQIADGKREYAVQFAAKFELKSYGTESV